MVCRIIISILDDRGFVLTRTGTQLIYLKDTGNISHEPIKVISSLLEIIQRRRGGSSSHVKFEMMIGDHYFVHMYWQQNSMEWLEEIWLEEG